MIDERSLIAGTKSFSAGYAAGAKTDFLFVPPYTYRDVQDMYVIKDRLNWLFAEIKAGHELREDIHGPTIRNILAIHHALVQKEHAYKRGPESHITTHYIWRTRDDNKVRPEHAANNGKVFSWGDAPHTGHPGDDFGCRCWAEPVREDAQEKKAQIVTYAASDASFSWTREEFISHYFAGNGDAVFLNGIGHLQNVIAYARSYVQPKGGSIFERVEQQIFEKARIQQQGSFTHLFKNSYDFSTVAWEIGGATLEGSSNVNVTKSGEFLVIAADVDYTFYDRFSDPLDISNSIPGSFDIIGDPYDIKGYWKTRIEAIIKINSSGSRFPDEQFKFG